MTTRPFVVHPSAPLLARLSLLPVEAGAAPAYARALVAEGMFLASRDLDAGAGQAARRELTARGYEIRARSRPTPHGVFAGVALAHVTRTSATHTPARLRLTGPHRARSNPSGAWLSALSDLLLGDTSTDPGPAALAANLVFSTSNEAVRRGERWHIETTGGDRVIGLATVRATAVTDLVFDACHHGAGLAEIHERVTGRWPRVSGRTVLETVTTLVRLGFLLTDLLPEDLGADPLSHVLARLPASHSARAPLLELREHLVAADIHPPGVPTRLRLLRAARDRADDVCAVPRPLTVDTAVDAELTVPAHLAHQVADAAGVLWRISTRPDPAAAYHQRFLHRYGPHRFVPFLQAADPVVGLGTTTDDPPTGPDPDERHRVLAGLIDRATGHRERGVVLTDLDISALARHGLPGSPPPTVDVHVRLLTGTSSDTADRTLRIVISVGGSQTAGATLARFTALLRHEVGSDSGSTAEGPLVAELVARPRTAAARALAPTAGAATHRIPVGVPARPEDTALTDLLLVSDGTTLAVWSATDDRQIVPVVRSRLNPQLLPPPARLLHVLGQAATRPWRGWSWGELGDGPHQPRVRYGRTILAPARWTIPPALTTAARGDRPTWDAQLRAWQDNAAARLPDIVVTDTDDRCLPLDLRRDDDRALLRRYVRRGLPAVTEQPGGEGIAQGVVEGPHGRHALELVVPLARRVTPPPPRHRTPDGVRNVGDGLYLPGSSWLSLAVTAPPQCQDQLLAGLARAAADLAPHWESWFWLRYSTPALGPHLRFRFHGEPAVLGREILPALCSWADTAIRAGLAGNLTVEPYDREIERYGGPDAVVHAELVFAADSRHALTLLHRGTDDRVAAAAHGAALIARTLAPGERRAVGSRHLMPSHRARRARLRPLTRTGAAASTGEDQADAAWTQLAQALATYRAVLAPHLRPGCASSVIHMHANRILTTTDDEPLMRALAADLLVEAA